jgi:hypothetical protein
MSTGTHGMDEAAQEVLRRYRVRNERKLYELVGRIACKRAGVDYPKQFEPMPLKAAELVPGIMRTVTSFKRGDGSVVRSQAVRRRQAPSHLSRGPPRLGRHPASHPHAWPHAS